MASEVMDNPINPTFNHASLYIGDLEPSVNESILFQIFNTIGPIASIRLCRDSTTRRSLGYGYLNFHSAADAERAIDTMNYTSIHGRQCRIMFSQRDPSIRTNGIGNVFVKNLDDSIDNKCLFDTFSVFGKILSCKVCGDSQGNSFGYGFVHYESSTSAANAIKNVNGMSIASKTVSVEPYKPKNMRNGGKPSFTNVYVKNFPEGFDKENFEKMFSSFGEITSMDFRLTDDGKPAGFGFVNYKTNDEASSAIEALHEKEPTNLYVQPAQSKQMREKQLRIIYEKRCLILSEKTAGLNLFVKNFGEKITDESLKDSFSKYGAITSAKVMKDERGNSKCFGFVCYTKKGDANEAIANMHGKMLDEKPIYVGLAQKKEIRRQQLELQQANSNRSKMSQPPSGPSQMYNQGNMFYSSPQSGNMQGQSFIYNNPLLAPPQGASQGGQRWNNQRPPQNNMFNPNMMIVPPALAQNRGSPFPFNQPRNMDMRKGPYNKNLRRPNIDQIEQYDNSQEQGEEVEEENKISKAEERNQIGEKLFKTIQETDKNLAGKITGMLLELPIEELRKLSKNEKELNSKINEAKYVLNNPEKK